MEALFKEAKHKANAARKAAAVKRNDFYTALQEEYTVENIGKWSANPGKLTPFSGINIVKKVIDSLTTAYISPATRTIEGSDADQATYADICKGAMIDMTLKQASKYVKLHKTALLRVVWRNGQIELDVLTPDLIDVTTGDSPRDLKSVMVTNFAESGKDEDTTYSVWTADTFKRLDWRGNVTESQPNPYKCLPFIPCWDSLPMDSFFVKGGADLINAQEAINEKLTDLLYIIRSQGFGIGWMKSSDHGPTGVGDISTVSIDPGGFVLLPNDANAAIGFEAPEAPIKETWEVIEAIIKQVAVANGLSAHNLTATPTGESGISKIISNQELMEHRQDDIELWRRYEGQLFEVIKTVWNVHSPAKKISDQAKFRVDFFDLADPAQEVQDNTKWSSLIANGQASPVDWAMARNPDLDREAAIKYLAQVRQEVQDIGIEIEKAPSFSFD